MTTRMTSWPINSKSLLAHLWSCALWSPSKSWGSWERSKSSRTVDSLATSWRMKMDSNRLVSRNTVVKWWKHPRRSFQPCSTHSSIRRCSGRREMTFRTGTGRQDREQSRRPKRGRWTPKANSWPTTGDWITTNTWHQTAHSSLRRMAMSISTQASPTQTKLGLTWCTLKGRSPWRYSWCRPTRNFSMSGGTYPRTTEQGVNRWTPLCSVKTGAPNATA